jgi:hypothetical protein
VPPLSVWDQRVKPYLIILTWYHSHTRSNPQFAATIFSFHPWRLQHHPPTPSLHQATMASSLPSNWRVTTSSCGRPRSCPTCAASASWGTSPALSRVHRRPCRLLRKTTPMCPTQPMIYGMSMMMRSSVVWASMLKEWTTSEKAKADARQRVTEPPQKWGVCLPRSYWGILDEARMRKHTQISIQYQI